MTDEERASELRQVALALTASDYFAPPDDGLYDDEYEFAEAMAKRTSFTKRMERRLRSLQKQMLPWAVEAGASDE